jgi:hypothetical protein
MGALLFAVAVALAIVPAGIAMGGIGVPPQQRILFASTQLILAAIAIGVAYQNRYRIWMQPIARLSRMFLTAGGASVGLLIGYLLVYNQCIVEHPLYENKILFPLWLSGKVAEMVRTAGSRYGAVDMYGLAAVFDAISEMPGAVYALTVVAMLALYAPPFATVSAIATILVLRYPSPLFRPSASPGEQFDVFLCYNRADKLGVRAIARELAGRQLRFFLDENENPRGQVWTEHVEAAIRSAPAFAVFIGPSGVGNWQGVEIQNITEERLTRGCNVIPVLLPDSPAHVRPPMQLAGLTWVDFRKPNPDPVAELVRGICTSPLRA